jgi:hypothetical protein
MLNPHQGEDIDVEGVERARLRAEREERIVKLLVWTLTFTCMYGMYRVFY